MNWRILMGAVHPKTKSATEQHIKVHGAFAETCKTAAAHTTKKALVVG